MGGSARGNLQIWCGGSPPVAEHDEQSLEARTWTIAKPTFPKAQDSYSLRAKHSLDQDIALFIAGQLLAPVRAIRLGYVPALRASVPEASIDEDGDTFVLEVEIRRTGDLPHSNLPSAHPVPYQMGPQKQFRRCIRPRFDRPHVPRAAWRRFKWQ
jgi:hypothetical protein